MVKNLPAMPETWVQSLDWEDPLEKRMATYSTILAWRIHILAWKEEPGRLQSIGSQRVGHDWETNTHFFFFHAYTWARFNGLWKNELVLHETWSSTTEFWEGLWSQVAQTIKSPPTMQETQLRSLSWEDPLEKEMATHSSILAWEIPEMEEPGGLQSMGSPRIRHNWVTFTGDLWMLPSPFSSICGP